MIDWILINIPPWVFIIFVAFGLTLGTVAYLILLERKVASWAQDRIGPNRVGPKGLLQPIADGLKMFVKEDYRPAGADKHLFSFAPALMMSVVIIALAVLPIAGVFKSTRTYDVTEAKLGAYDLRLAADAKDAGHNEAVEKIKAAVVGRIPINASLDGEPTAQETGGKILASTSYTFAFQAAKLNLGNIGVLFILASLSLAVYGVVVAGWASNNKYSFFGGMRAAAQMISYEIPLGLSVLCVALLFGTLELDELAAKQAHYWFGVIPAWNVFSQPVAFVLFLICIHAEANRLPFDLAECEQELVGGYHTEYASMRLGLLLLAEYGGMIVTSGVCVAMFFGGWHFWGLAGPDPKHPEITSSVLIIALRCVVFFAKTLCVIFVFMWTRWSLPRFRYDQLMLMAWRGLIPIGLGLLMATAVTMYFVGGSSEMYRERRMLDGLTALVFLAMNVVFILTTMVIARLLPQPLPTNRRIVVANSRFNKAVEELPVVGCQLPVGGRQSITGN
jgi:NADH-quinone oxidoreductase subunit H